VLAIQKYRNLLSPLVSIAHLSVILLVRLFVRVSSPTSLSDPFPSSSRLYYGNISSTRARTHKELLHQVQLGLCIKLRDIFTAPAVSFALAPAWLVPRNAGWHLTLCGELALIGPGAPWAYSNSRFWKSAILSNSISCAPPLTVRRHLGTLPASPRQLFTPELLNKPRLSCTHSLLFPLSVL
jgi:hypothetical protein